VHPHDHVNASQSSNDTFPGVTKVTCLKILPGLVQHLRNIQKTCTLHSNKRKKLKKVGRTHLQDAVVITLGDQFGAYARTIQKNIEYIQKATNVCYELNF
jgi:aspartate ammonia-lyase